MVVYGYIRIVLGTKMEEDLEVNGHLRSTEVFETVIFKGGDAEISQNGGEKVMASHSLLEGCIQGSLGCRGGGQGYGHTECTAKCQMVPPLGTIWTFLIAPS